MHFSLVKINPEDAQPSHGFDDVILPLYYALQHLGYQAEILFNRVNPKSRNIVFGSCIAPRRVGRELPPGSVIFNLEQLTPDSKWCNPNYLAHLRDYTVWDYSARNVAGLAEQGITAAHVPLGYVPEMTRLPHFSHFSGPGQSSAPAGLLFYGLITERRDAMLRKLVAERLPLLASQDAFGDLRDKLLLSSRLVLNLHNYLPARLEVVRLGYVWANKKPVLSERRADTEIPDYLAEACCFVEYDDLPAAAARLLGNQTELDRQSERGFKAFSSRPMTAGLEKLLGRRSHGAATAIQPHAAAPADPAGRPPEWQIRKPA
ncbi:MAG: hypothetical protein LBM64_07350 [Deltaproteobacteria bacterium]|jgi:hypothetical protein|nr:hypothetical protein [Deltaproteobacteria bacterium]